MAYNNEVDEFNKLTKKIEKLKNRIDILSTYDPLLLGKVISKLMTAFEGSNYELKVEENVFTGTRYDIVAEEDPEYKVSFRIFSYDEETNEFFDTFTEKSNKCIFYPSNYDIGKDDEIEEELDSEENNTSYIQDFSDFLFNERSKDNILKADEEYLNSKLKLFLELFKDKKEQRIEEIKNEEEIDCSYEDYLTNCVVDRRTIFKSIKYILNNYSNSKAFEVVDEENVKYDNCQGKKINHTLRIESKAYKEGTREIRYNNLLTYPLDAEIKEHDYINYCNLKECLGEELLNDCQVLDDFLYNVEDLFKASEEIGYEDITSLLDCYRVENIKKKELVLKDNE